jgi:cyclase
VGHPVKSSKVYSDQDADELLLLNISRDSTINESFIKTVKEIAQNCFVPLAVGGGIRKKSHAVALFEAGADKIVLNTCAYDKSELVAEIAQDYGKQSIIVGIDVRKVMSDYRLFSQCGKEEKKIKLKHHLKRVVDLGAGEVFLQAIDFDGLMQGYDLKLLELALKTCPVPIILAGGAGSFMDLRLALAAGASAVACGSLFNFGDNNPLRAKAFLKNYNIPLKNIS